MFGLDVAGLVTLISASSAAIVAIITAWHQRDLPKDAKQNVANTSQTLHEVKTMNELTIGQLGEAAETRRIQEKPPEDRTTREGRHVDSALERSTGA